MWGPLQFRDASLRRRPEVYYFDKEFVEEVQTAGPKRLAELSRTHDGARRLVKDAARFAAGLNLKQGLRYYGDGQSEVVPNWTVLRKLFSRQRFMVNGGNYVTVESTLCCSLGFAVCDANGAPLLVKGESITSESLADARAARNKLVADRSDYVADLVKADAVRDVARAARAAGASPKPLRATVKRSGPRRGPCVGPRAPPGSFPATLAAILKDTDDQSPIAFSAAAHGIVIQDRPMLRSFLRDRGWQKDVADFTRKLGPNGFRSTWVPGVGQAYVNPDVASVGAIADMKLPTTKKRKAKGTGAATAPKRTRGGAS